MFSSRPIFPSRKLPSGETLVPAHFELCETEDIVSLVVRMLERLVSHNDRIPFDSSALTRFHSRSPPPISVRDYLHRIAKFTKADPCCFLILLCYIDKVCESIPRFTISSLTVHRFVIAAVAVSSKALSDSFYLNDRYARIGGVNVTEMNLLEKEFLSAVEWRLIRTRQVLSQYYLSLVESNPNYQVAENTQEEDEMYSKFFFRIKPDTRQTDLSDLPPDPPIVPVPVQTTIPPSASSTGTESKNKVSKIQTPPSPVLQPDGQGSASRVSSIPPSVPASPSVTTTSRRLSSSTKSLEKSASRCQSRSSEESKSPNFVPCT